VKVNNRILLADDDRELNEELSEILKSEGYAVTSVFDGNDALKNILTGAFDLLIMDFKMPGLDGIQVLREIQKGKKAVKAIIISGKPFIENLVDHEEFSGILQCVFTKPFNIEELLLALKQA
jgi:DNA-binding response OmpR family regulator